MLFTLLPQCEECEKEVEELLTAGKNYIQLQLMMNQFQNYLKKTISKYHMFGKTSCRVLGKFN